MLPKKLVYLFTGVLLLSLVACTALNDMIPVTGGAQTPSADTSLANTSWRLVSYGEPGSEIPVLEGTEVTLQFEDGSQAGGSGGCSMFGAQYNVADGKELSITEVVSTLMACSAEDLMEQETQYFEALQSADSFELLGDRLTIRYGGGQSVLTFSRITSSIPNSVYL